MWFGFIYKRNNAFKELFVNGSDKKYNVLVRITIDSFDDAILNVVRPSKSAGEPTGMLLRKTVEKLIESEIEFAVRTTITRYNYNNILELAKRIETHESKALGDIYGCAI